MPILLSLFFQNNVIGTDWLTRVQSVNLRENALTLCHGMLKTPQPNFHRPRRQKPVGTLKDVRIDQVSVSLQQSAY